MAAAFTAGLQRETLEAAYTRLEKPLFNVLLRWVWNRDEAMDVLHEAFERVWKARKRIDQTTLDPFVWKTALNLAANRRRGHKLRAFFGLEAVDDVEANEPSATDQLHGAKVELQVRRAIDALPEKLRQVVVLCELSGLSYEVIARMLEIPVGTVGSRRSAALARLAITLGPLQEDV